MTHWSGWAILAKQTPTVTAYLLEGQRSLMSSLMKSEYLIRQDMFLLITFLSLLIRYPTTSDSLMKEWTFMTRFILEYKTLTEIQFTAPLSIVLLSLLLVVITVFLITLVFAVSPMTPAHSQSASRLLTTTADTIPSVSTLSLLAHQPTRPLCFLQQPAQTQ